MNIHFEKNFHLTLTPKEAEWLRSQLVDAIDRLIDEKDWVTPLYDLADEDERNSLKKLYQDPIDFNLTLRESLMQFRTYLDKVKEAENNG